MHGVRIFVYFLPIIQPVHTQFSKYKNSRQTIFHVTKLIFSKYISPVEIGGSLRLQKLLASLVNYELVKIKTSSS